MKETDSLTSLEYYTFQDAITATLVRKNFQQWDATTKDAILFTKELFNLMSIKGIKITLTPKTKKEPGLYEGTPNL